MSRPTRRLARGRPPAGGRGRVALRGLRAAREARGLSQDGLVHLVAALTIAGEAPPQLGRSTLRGWEDGRLAERSIVPYLAAALGCSERRLREAPRRTS